MRIENYMKDFQWWSVMKPKIHDTTINFFPKEREVWFVSLGMNIWSETDGKTDYRRPVIVLKKVWSLYFCVPLTTKHKDNIYHYHLGKIAWKDSSILLSQVKVLDARRFINNIWRIDEQDLLQIKKLIQEMYLG